MKYNLRSLYLCVDEMERALNFYEDFFEMPPLIKDDIYSVFAIGGFRLGLFAYKMMREEHTYGSNCLPSIEVESLELLNQKLAGLELCFPLTKIKDNWAAEFVDSEGNHIEMTAPV